MCLELNEWFCSPKIRNVTKKNYTWRLTYRNVTDDLYYSYTLRLSYAYFTDELCIRYGWVIINLQLSYAYVMAELWLQYGFVIIKCWVMVTIRLCYNNVPAQNPKCHEKNYTWRLTYRNVADDLYHSDMLRLSYAFFTAELCIHYGWVIIKLRLSYAYVMAELWLQYGFVIVKWWVMVTIRLCYNNVPAENKKCRETNYTWRLTYRNISADLNYLDTLRSSYAYFTAEL